MFNESESLITLSRAFHNPVESGKNDLLNLSVLQGKSVKLTADLSDNPDLCCEVAGIIIRIYLLSAHNCYIQ